MTVYNPFAGNLSIVPIICLLCFKPSFDGKIKKEVTIMPREARDGAQYVRQQKGHSLIKWIILSCFGIGIPFLIYYAISPNHYFHA